MRANGLEILAIVVLFGTYVIECTTNETTLETPVEQSTTSPEQISTSDPLKVAVTTPNNATAANLRMENWMARMGVVQLDLLGIQAIIVKDEDAKGACDPAERKSDRRYLMCAGSILNRNHILSSASCLHEATHIRHNIRSPLAVVIAPLRQSIQVIRVTEYKIHPGHQTNPYSQFHLIHNVAILKLACRIDMDNFYKIELPTTPFFQTCSEDNCIAAVYRKTGMTSNVMFQVMAPNIPFPNRRRKQTMVKDVELRRFQDSKKEEPTRDFHEHPRERRKLAEPPIFMSRYEQRKKSSSISTNSTASSTLEHSTILETTTMTIGRTNLTNTGPNKNRSDHETEVWISPSISNETIKSIVRRSSTGYNSCPQTGSAVMANRTQAAIVSVPCDDRQKSTKWLYTDLYDNLDWIHDILQDWSNTSLARPSGAASDTGTGPGNYSGCSTCIFNFFIEIGCKDKKSCGNKTGSGLDGSGSASGLTSQNQACSGPNSIGIEVGIGGQGCDKKDTKAEPKPEYRGMPGKPIDPQIGGSGGRKHLPKPRADGSSKLETQSMIGNPAKNTVKDHRNEKDKYARRDKARMNKNAQRGRVTNEIGLQNVDGDPTDWLSEVEKGLDMSNEMKRELMEARRAT